MMCQKCFFLPTYLQQLQSEPHQCFQSTLQEQISEIRFKCIGLILAWLNSFFSLQCIMLND